jgi:hypothetical protein
LYATGEQVPETFERSLSETQSRKCRQYCQKLAYYSATREFRSKKSGKYKFKVAFLTLTAPADATPEQMLKAFDGFLDYLRRTANCVFVWKKELGEQNHRLHFHLIINNFIPYYIIDWKWKRLLIASGVSWPVNAKGVHTSSHYRVELPRNRRQVSHYISKYLSKAFLMPKQYGYIFGHSKVLDDCKELVLIEGDFPNNEIQAIRKVSHCIDTEFMTHICIDLLTVIDVAPMLGELFNQQYLQFTSIITEPQKFNFVN